MLADGIFKGRTALVTGGGTGLGLATSIRMGRLGANVVCASRDTAHHKQLIEHGERDGFAVMSAKLDVREPKDVKRVVQEAVARFGRIDVCVNNAAGNFIRPSMLLAPKGFRTVIDIALNGVFYVSREVGRVMRDGGGSIVNISAPYASTGKPGVVHSACAKAGVETMTRTLAAEWAQYGIRVNAVSPGPFVTAGAVERLWPNEELERALIKQIPMGRLGNVDEIAELVCFLASSDASWITGSVLVADGGWSLPVPFVGEDKVPRRREEGE